MIDKYRSIFEDMKKDVIDGGNPYYIAKARLSEFEDSVTFVGVVRNLCHYITIED